ncbi:MAG: DUF4358 domain-containing protein [Blautia sp.]|nr:DUF4358 domain-containing protein [Lachnoclostridium sp.]MCM1211355.1 DUF4358 domain-containing protein [Blautia sp.]
MIKKVVLWGFLNGLLLCMLSGCGENIPTDELVREGQAFEIQGGEDEIEAGSSGVENEMRQGNREFPTLSELKKSVKEELGEHYWPEIPLSGKELEEKTGITKEMYVEFLAEEQNTEADIDTMIIIHAKEDYVGTVEQALEDYRSQLIQDNLEYPQNLGKAKASRMETIENYICFVQLGADTSIVSNKGEEEIIAYCQEENERAIHILEKSILEFL